MNKKQKSTQMEKDHQSQKRELLHLSQNSPLNGILIPTLLKLLIK